MRLSKLKVRHFRALESIDISFRPMTVIIGENDVGKSSLMFALRALFESKKLDDPADFFMRDIERGGWPIYRTAIGGGRDSVAAQAHHTSGSAGASPSRPVRGPAATF